MYKYVLRFLLHLDFSPHHHNTIIPTEAQTTLFTFTTPQHPLTTYITNHNHGPHLHRHQSRRRLRHRTPRHQSLRITSTKSTTATAIPTSTVARPDTRHQRLRTPGMVQRPMQQPVQWQRIFASVILQRAVRIEV